MGAILICLLFTWFLTCINCQGDLPCVVGNETIPDYVCENGNWPNADANIDSDWIVSRSTHYGSTAGGACGFDNIPNCYYPGAECDIPMEIQTSPFAGQYAAPQGDYYTQLGDYLSCGECFELQCVDPTCTYNKPIYINIADSCPCKPNPKWCCGEYSDCQELRPDTISNQHHCAKEQNGTWVVNASLHLDLNDIAYAMVTTGEKGQVPNSGSVNTLMRRVSCPVNGSVYIMIDASSMYTDNCYTVYPEPKKPCFTYLAFNAYNVAGYGSIANVTIKCGLVENNQMIYKEIPIHHNPHYPLDNDQERYGNYVGPNSVALYFPLQFILTDRGGRNISSPVIANFSSGWPAFYNMNTQFPPIITPTISPSKSPTMTPTMPPSMTPTATPTMSPIDLPTFDPTFEPTLFPTHHSAKSVSKFFGTTLGIIVLIVSIVAVILIIVSVLICGPWKHKLKKKKKESHVQLVDDNPQIQ